MAVLRNLSLALATAAALTGAAAEAHPRLVSSTPGANALASRPASVQLRFSERLVAPMTGADVVMTGMPGAMQHQPVKMNGFVASMGTDGKTLTLVRKQPLPAGRYTVSWHAVSVDTHRVAGRFAFAVK